MIFSFIYCLILNSPTDDVVGCHSQRGEPVEERADEWILDTCRVSLFLRFVFFFCFFFHLIEFEMYKRRKCACCFPPCPPAISIGTPKRERTCRYVLSSTVKEEKELLDKVLILFFRRIAHFIFIRLHLSYSLHFIWVKVTEIITRLMYFIYKYKSAIYLCGCLLFLWYLKKESETAQLIGSPPVWVDVRHSSISIPIT